MLSKSNYLKGLQCPKLLWVTIHRKEELPETDIGTQYMFDQGTSVGKLATKKFPDGLNIPTENFKGNLDNTKKFLKFRKPLFEPAFLVDNLYSRADILVPVEDDLWDIVEVKSGTKLKEVNIHDVSFQKHVYEKAGLKIRNCYLLHVNNKYVRQGELDLEQLFIMEDITKDVENISEGLEKRIKEMFEIIKAENMPELSIHMKCDDPYKCPIEECWDMDENNVFELYRMGKKAFELYDDGVVEMKDIPEDYPLSEKQEIQLKCALKGETHIEKGKIKEFMENWEKPLHYLDFESFQTAIPMFDGVKPYEQIPFQFSLHVGKKHHGFLYKGDKDPRKEFWDKLKGKLGEKGSIVVYNASFEKNVIKGLGGLFGEEEIAEELNNRIVDLLVVFRNFWWYSSKQKGSASLKNVLPAVTGKDYSGLDIADGQTASVAYLNVTYGDGSDKEKVYDDLEKYCSLDTEGMVWIVGKLNEL
jgi:hypothetical protein